MLAINADARRRFENAPVLTQLSELSMPHLDTYPDKTGRWLSDGLPKRLWNRLRSLQLIDDMMRPDVLAQLTESPFWKQLRSLTVNLPVHQTAEIMAILRDRLPPALENLRLIANHSPVQLGDGNSFYARLAKTPLRQLEIKWAPIGSTALQGLLDASSSCELRELSLRECDFSDEHMGVLAESPGTRQLESLSVSQYRGVTAASAPSFFQSENLQGLAGLNLAISAYCIWSDGISALARSTHWKNLRRLELTGGGLNHETLRKLLASPFANQLVRLTVECDDVGGPIERASLFERIHRLPHLARLHVTVNEIDDELRMQSNRLKRQGWTTIQCHNSATDYYVDTSELPPLDDDLESSDQVP
jgi:hypothetical protein